MNTKLKLEKIYKRYGSKTVLDALDLEVEEGEFMVVLGPSGMGKSTLLRVIVGIEDLTAGRVIVDGTDVSDL
ncbi:ABC transporter galacturonide binding/ATPase protein, partial [mine drainage metagenome]